MLEREKATSEAYGYSVALTRLGGRWSYEELNAFLANPKGFAPGTRMGGVQGVKDAPTGRASSSTCDRTATILRQLPSSCYASGPALG